MVSGNQNHANTIASFDVNLSGSGRPYIFIDILGADDKFHRIRVLEDTGNDITLLNLSAAHELGFDRLSDIDQGQRFKVQGIAPTPLDFRMIKTKVSIGGIDPIDAKIGFGNIKENLLGREDILDNFSIAFTKRKITFTKLPDTANGLSFNFPTNDFFQAEEMPGAMVANRHRPQFMNLR